MKNNELDLSIDDALANLSTIANMDIDLKEPIGTVKKNRFVIQSDDESYKSIDWVLPEQPDDLIQNVLRSYQVLLDHLKKVCDKDYLDLSNERSKRGLRALMTLAENAKEKIDSYLDLLKDKGIKKVGDSNEYQEFKEFFLKKFSKKLDMELDGKEVWQNQWKDNENSFLLDIEKSGFKDFESIKNDSDYELFYLLDDEDEPYFTHNQLTNIKLFCSFNELNKKNEDDPLLKVRVLLDKDYQNSADNMLKASYERITLFYKEKYYKNISNELIALINKAIFSLMLAANPKNLIGHTYMKNSIEYFHDFLTFIRNVLASDEYLKIIAFSNEEKKSKIIIDLIGSLLKSLFFKELTIKQEIIGFIHHLIRLGEDKKKHKYPKDIAFWETVVKNDESINIALSSLPSGPMMKLLDVLSEENINGFDPIRDENIPSKMYEIKYLEKNLKVSRLASPTMQLTISDPKIIEEFKEFIRSLKENESFLMLNFQNKHSFKESPRCHILDAFQKKSDFLGKIFVVTLDKQSEFYTQSGIFLNLNLAKHFKEEFKKELSTNGFTLIVSKSFSKFIDNSIDFVHKVFFNNSENLSRNNRLDFIEIFYNFLILKIMEILKPDFMSFTDKDAIDYASASMSSFFVFLKLLLGDKFDKKDEDYLRLLLYYPAFLIRERSINSKQLNRVASSLSHFEIEMLAKKDKVLKEISSLFDPHFLKTLKISY